MANRKESGVNSQQVVAPQEEVIEEAKTKTKTVRNRSNGKIELLINGEIVVFPPKSSVEVPIDFEVPGGIGLYVK